jgi:hypothetical protein
MSDVSDLSENSSTWLILLNASSCPMQRFGKER